MDGRHVVILRTLISKHHISFQPHAVVSCGRPVVSSHRLRLKHERTQSEKGTSRDKIDVGSDHVFSWAQINPAWYCLWYFQAVHANDSLATCDFALSRESLRNETGPAKSKYY